ncbi:MAG: bifunctional riboflavin kinase/FAD synthetase [Armatimonadota bacterium]
MSQLDPFHGLPRWPRGSAVAVGVFDGVHAGHRRLIDTTRRWAVGQGAGAAALTFDPHPAALFRPGARGAMLLQTVEDRVAELRAAGLDRVGVARFDHAFAAQDPEQFVDSVLLDRLGAACVVVGDDFRFGAGQAGNALLLEEMGRRKGFGVEVVPEVRVDGVPARSTVIRERLESGDVGAARGLLGRPHRVSGTVIGGKRLGRTIGFPTANLDPPAQLVIPASGVYAAVARGDFGERAAAVSVGVNATVDPQAAPTVEAFLLDYSGDLYGTRLTVDFLERVRGMEAFEGLDALKAAIARDVDQVRAIVAGEPV